MIVTVEPVYSRRWTLAETYRSFYRLPKTYRMQSTTTDGRPVMVDYLCVVPGTILAYRATALTCYGAKGPLYGLDAKATVVAMPRELAVRKAIEATRKMVE